MEVIFGHCLDARFKMIEKLKNARCEKGIEHSCFLGYQIGGIARGEELKIITLGFRVRDGAIVGYGYYAGDDWYGEELVEEAFLGDMEKLLDSAVVMLAKDACVDSTELLVRKKECVQPALVVGKNTLINDRISRLTGLKSVLLKTGFGEVWCKALLGWSEPYWVIALVDVGYGECQSVFEWKSTEKQEVVRLWSRLRGSARVSKKGNTWYCIESDTFNKFKRVKGKSFRL